MNPFLLHRRRWGHVTVILFLRSRATFRAFLCRLEARGNDHSHPITRVAFHPKISMPWLRAPSSSLNQNCCLRIKRGVWRGINGEVSVPASPSMCEGHILGEGGGKVRRRPSLLSTMSPILV